MTEQRPSKELTLIEHLIYCVNGCEFNGMPNTADACRKAIAEIERLKRQQSNLIAALGEKQAKIDVLMLEFYPGELSPEQRELAKSERRENEQSGIVKQMRLAGYHDWASAVERLQRPGCPCKGHPTNCFRHPHDCGCNVSESAELLANAERIVADYARRNPKWADVNGVIQDPWGTHAWLERYRATKPPGDDPVDVIMRRGDGG